MDIPEGNISAKKLTAENLNIELGGGGDELPPAAVPLAVPKLKIFNQATLPQTIQYWLVVVLSVGSIVSYVATWRVSVMHLYTKGTGGGGGGGGGCNQ